MRLARVVARPLSVLALSGALAAPLQAAVVVLEGAMDNLQVVAPVFGDPSNPDLVTGATHFRSDGVTPVSTSTATGFARVTIDTVALTMVTDVTWQGLTGPADRAHLHDAPISQTILQSPPNDRFFHEVIWFDFNANGDPIPPDEAIPPVPCPGDPTSPCAPATGQLRDRLTIEPFRWETYGPDGVNGTNGTLEDMIASFVAGGLFLDIHTEAYPGGEIRGQLRAVPEPAAAALAALALAALGWSRRARH